jgi:hypothetical protein
MLICAGAKASAMRRVEVISSPERSRPVARAEAAIVAEALASDAPVSSVAWGTSFLGRFITGAPSSAPYGGRRFTRASSAVFIVGMPFTQPINPPQNLESHHDWSISMTLRPL